MIFSDNGVIVPDVSFYQDNDLTPGKIDFVKMKSAGVSGVVVRGGQNEWIDEDFRDYWRDSKAAGLPRGTYWFYDSRIDPGRQANLWRAAIGQDYPELGFWCDFEDSYKGAYHGERYWKQFVLAIEAFFPQSRVGIYTANWWWNTQTVTDPMFWSARPLWVAQYTVNPADVVLPNPWKTKGCVLWQFTSHGNGGTYGVESANIDLNKWNGTLESFKTYFNLTDTPPVGKKLKYTIDIYSNGSTNIIGS